MTADTIASHLYGPDPRPAQLESVRRALRTLRQRDLIDISTRPVSRTRRSLKRVFDLSACDPDFCSACARRTRRVRLQDWHRQTMRDLARHDPGWLQDLAIAEASGFVHHAASTERLVSNEPDAVDHHRRPLQHATPIQPDFPDH